MEHFTWIQRKDFTTRYCRYMIKWNHRLHSLMLQPSALQLRALLRGTVFRQRICSFFFLNQFLSVVNGNAQLLSLMKWQPEDSRQMLNLGRQFCKELQSLFPRNVIHVPLRQIQFSLFLPQGSYSPLSNWEVSKLLEFRSSNWTWCSTIQHIDWPED